MLFKHIKSNVEIDDSEFDSIYPKDILEASEMHFTPIIIAKIAARYLVDGKESKILDVGSGAGKFCMIGSACTDGYFVGVELRENLCSAATLIAEYYNLSNVEFIHSNITAIKFRDYNGFYFYNPFYENVCLSGRIDEAVELRRDLFDEYSLYVKQQLSEMPIGTKLVTYFSYLKEIPDSYKVHFSSFDNKLKMWEKVF